MFAKSGYIKIFSSGDVTRSSQVFTLNTVFKIQVPRFSQCKVRCKVRALYDACSVANIPSGVLGTKVNPDTCGRVNPI